MNDIALEASGSYGAGELKKNYQRYLVRGLTFATILHLAGIGLYYTPDLRGEEKPKLKPPITGTIVGLPPSLTRRPAPVISVTTPAAHQSNSIPIPVPDINVPADQTIPSQIELGQITGPIVEQGDGDFEEPPREYVFYEKGPQAVRQVQPLYPELAIKAGVQGTVWIKIWVDKQGKIRQAVVVKSDAELLNQAATDAAMQWVFTPAIQYDKPVSVWVSIPFRFKLADR